MGLDILQRLKDITTKRPGSAKKSGKTGYTVSLQEGEHRIAPYSTDKGRVTLGDIRTASTEELQDTSLRSKSLTVCFSPRSIYADMGDFSSISTEATLAHIRSTIDKTGLFNEQYALSFRKVYDIDNVRARYSYLAVPATEVARIGILNENEVFLDTYCPVEASIASLVAVCMKEMAIAVFEDENFVRLIGAKSGIIYHLITIHKQNAFDLFAEVLAGISEMNSLMKNTYNDPPQAVYLMSRGEISTGELNENGIEAKIFEMDGLSTDSLSSLMLLGNVFCSGYNFLPGAYRDTRALAGFARFSMGISLAVAVLSALLFFLGFRNSSEALDFEQRTQRTQQEYAKDMNALERDYANLLKELDLSHINELISLYQDFQSEPKLHAILGTITQAVPHDMTLKRIEVLRSDMKPEQTQSQEEEVLPTSSANATFRVKIEGVITAQYPQSKILFTTFLSGVQASYPVLSASFRHTAERASYSVECEAKK